MSFKSLNSKHDLLPRLASGALSCILMMIFLYTRSTGFIIFGRAIVCDKQTPPQAADTAYRWESFCIWKSSKKCPVQ